MADGIWQRLVDGLSSCVDGIHPYAWLVMTVFVAFFSVVMRPVALDAADYWRRSGMTPQERQESYGMPFQVSKPPAGVRHILNREQLRWVLLQEIRMDAMKSCLNQDNEEAVRGFMRMVDDYNAHGASYLCEASELRAARCDIEEYQEEIRKNAIAEAEALGWNLPLQDK